MEGVEFIHNENIVHRDLKPGNVLVDYTGCIKISDFGVSNDFTNKAEYLSYEVVGTRKYMAPEVLLEIGYWFPADIWAIHTS